MNGSPPGGGVVSSIPMSCSRVAAAAFLFLELVCSPAAARSRHQPRPTPQAAPGDFAYYVLSLSWSPQYCAGAGDGDPQCSEGRRLGIVAHGLWPQYEKGWPESCGGGPLEGALVDAVLDIMPSPKLIRHEWEKHGTCSGLLAADYFLEIRKALAGIHTPPTFQGPSATVATTPEGFRRAFLDANPRLGEADVAIECSGRYLQEVRVCLDRNLAPRQCSPDVRDHCAGPQMIVRPVR
jgi:ribonuclease T2